MRRDEDVNTPMVAVVGAVIVVFFFALIIFVQAVFLRVSDQVNNERYISRKPMEVSTLLAQQNTQLLQYREVNPSQAIVAIPIDRAMRLVVEECEKKTCSDYSE